MDLVNATHLRCAYTQGLDPDGRERLVVIVKGTYRIPRAGGEALPADEHAELVFADTFTGEPGFSAVVLESDFAPYKPRCDVLLVGSAHAPLGQPATHVHVGMQVGPMTKEMEVVGPRYWTGGVIGIVPSAPEPFVRMPITYDRAFGGGDASKKHPGLRNAYASNPVGTGYFEDSDHAEIFGTWAPNTQEVGRPVESPRGSYRPMAFGPVGRNFASRLPYAGTYDDAWLAEVFPFLPADFDPQYFQAAPPDQQIPYPVGGERVGLLNLSAEPVPPFHLPAQLEMPIEITRAGCDRVEQNAVVDTIVLEPDAGVLHLVWRTSFPLRRNIQEVVQIVVGRMSPGWYRARALGKTYYRSLAELAAAKAGGR